MHIWIQLGILGLVIFTASCPEEYKLAISASPINILIASIALGPIFLLATMIYLTYMEF